MLTELSRDELDQIAPELGPLGQESFGREEVTVLTPDGVVLAGTLTRPVTGRAPVVLLRTPYGRAHLEGFAAHLASHGYAVLAQDTRAAASYFFEANDGRVTVDWIESQPWFDGHLLLAGFSYLGFTAWATASTHPASLRAIAIAEYSSDRTSGLYPGGAFALEQALSWSVENEGKSRTPPRDEDFLTLPLQDADRTSTGDCLPFYQERLAHGPDSPHWDPISFTRLVETVAVPVLLLDGWYDYHRIPIFTDFERLETAGVPRRLVFGPWTHNPLDMRRFLDETLRWFDLHVRGVGPAIPEVSLYDTGNAEWVDVEEWPRAETRVFHATSHHELLAHSEGYATDVSWTYDPEQPTPALGLTAFGGLDVGGPQDNRPLLDREDVISFRGRALDGGFRAAGRVTAHGVVRADAPSVDVFIRVLDVAPSGLVVNVCDAIRRVSAPELQSPQGYALEMDLGPIMHRFADGHAVGVLLAGGAFPYFDRNLGHGDPSQTATRSRETHASVRVGGEDGLILGFSILAQAADSSTPRS